MGIVWAIIGLLRHGNRKSALSILVGTSILITGLLGTAIKNPHMNDSVLHRAELFTNSSGLWLEKPVAGHGVGGFSYEYPRVQQRHAIIFPQLKSLLLSRIFTQTQTAHNEFLKFLIEFGLIGFGLLLAILFGIVRNYLCSPRDKLKDTAFITCVAVLVLAVLVFPFQVPATAFFAIVCLATISRRNNDISDPTENASDLRQISVSRPTKFISAILGIALITGWSGGAIAAYLGGLHIYTADTLEKHNPAKYYAAVHRAYVADPFSPMYRRRLFVSLMNWAKNEKRLPVPNEKFDQTYELALSAGSYFPGILFSRIEYLEMLPETNGQNAEIERLLFALKKTVPLFPETYLYEAQHAIRSKDMARARSSIDKADRLWSANKETRQLSEILRKNLTP